MICLNFTNLDAKTQSYLLALSLSNIENKYGAQLKRYAQENDMDFKSLLEQETQRNLYEYEYEFKI